MITEKLIDENGNEVFILPDEQGNIFITTSRDENFYNEGIKLNVNDIDFFIQEIEKIRSHLLGKYD
jgi:hypothetical protein